VLPRGIAGVIEDRWARIVPRVTEKR